MKILYYSGRIRNRDALCRSLSIPKGEDPYQQDIRMLERAWQEWGEELCLRLCGAFAIVLETDDRLLLFRDHFGIECLYYAQKNGELFFSDSAAELIAGSGVSGHFNEQMMYAFFLYGYAFGEETFYREVYKLLPGHLLVWDKKNGCIAEKRAWFKPMFYPQEEPRLAYWSDRVRQTVEEVFADEAETIRGNKTGSFLSSGVDSSYMLASADIRDAYCVGYDKKRYRTEAPEARETARFLHRSFHEVHVSTKEYAKAFEAITAAQDQPSTNASLPAFYIACKKAAKKHTLMFSGEGPDEFFAGYYGYVDAAAAASDLQNPYLGCGQMMSLRQYEQLMKEPKPCVSDVHREIYADTESSGYLSRMLRTDISLFLEGDTLSYLSTVKKMTGLQISLPFLDPRVFALAAVMPDIMKRNSVSIGSGKVRYYVGNKFAFRMAASEKLPYETALRRKIGFFAPLSKMLLEEPLRSTVTELLFGGPAEPFFREEFLRSSWSALSDGDDGAWHIIFSVAAFLAWYKKHFDAFGDPIL